MTTSLEIEPVMNMSNSAEKTTVGGRSASKVFGALSGKSRGESHWVSRSWENKQIFSLKEVEDSSMKRVVVG